MAVLYLPSIGHAQPPDIQQWRRWEGTIESSVDFTDGDGNPYRDLTLRVEFRSVDAAGLFPVFTQDAFWAGDPSAPRQFKVRAALPAGTWSWQVVGCTGSTGGHDCASGVTWTPAGGVIRVGASTSSGVRLYDRGFPVQYQFIVADPMVHLGYGGFSYADNSTEPFFWLGDTAWAAVSREAAQAPSSRKWEAYLADRRSRGFTAILLAPQPAWKPDPGETWPGLPDAVGYSFEQMNDCNSAAPVPNDCSRPRKAYWDLFDAMVDRATAQDLVVVVAGVIDPSDLGKDGTYPGRENALDFARFLAARLAGNAVLFSPTFDDKLGSRTAGNAITVSQVVAQVAPAILEASPRSLLSLHLAGSATCGEYESYRASGWMTFFLYHSGHAFTDNGIPGTLCSARLDGESQVDAALRRAREIPLALRASSANPAMPAINGEGPYDAFPILNDPLDNRYRVRQTAYVTLLSNGKGFTYGTTRLSIWDQVGATLNIDSALDMQRLAARFRSLNSLPARHAWILDQASGTADEKRIVLATNESTLLLAYLPGDRPRASILVDARALPAFSCVRGWTIRWFDPTSNTANGENIHCELSDGRIEIQKPESCTNAACDWLLELQRTSNTEGTPQDEIPPGETVDPWTDSVLAGPTTGIYVKDRGVKGPPVEVSPPGRAFLRSPRLAWLGKGGPGYLLVWEAEGLDGSLYGVFGRRLDRQGAPIGEEFQINTTTEHDQRDPALAAGADGNTLVVWSGFGQDGDRGGIFGQRLDPLGKPLGEELPISEEAAGHPMEPQVIYDRTGAYVVAWSTRAEGATPGRVSVRAFDRSGRALFKEVALRGRSGRTARLIDLRASEEGGFVLRWTEEDSLGTVRPRYEQAFTKTGGFSGAQVQVLP